MITDKKQKKGCSLSENITVLFILGIIIAITVPKLITSRNEKNLRLQVRKLLVTYQGILDKELLKDTGVSASSTFNMNLKSSHCQRIKRNFNVVTDNGCQFTTADGVRWDFGTYGPTNLIISVRSDEPSLENAANPSNNTVFYIPCSVSSNRTVNLLETWGNPRGVDLNQREAALNKTRNFIINE